MDCHISGMRLSQVPFVEIIHLIQSVLGDPIINQQR